MVVITRVISLTNFVVASSALGFQVFVLYPWHKELDAGFEELKKEHLRVLGAVSGGPAITREQGQVMQEKLSELNQKKWWFQSR
ncbi:hypothetical protein M406DRAFT_255275 [Cryphonectria parasitica EP155]|uniref:Mitochondrial phosphate carrier protein n=1 Tax=Cryphonectria parasitica (strain ATCC 38755 / EP155) TaxID=660469 RepID=A0A9P5CPW2_CRYP1|nr:uncharacterized protein M406DRAFT_255275 [Cryphonectria parasitica EP155]KAF3766593.1 hypothetical protein M406DRAFT_255275 [Cryphonectria parasitica EP155]